MGLVEMYASNVTRVSGKVLSTGHQILSSLVPELTLG